MLTKEQIEHAEELGIYPKYLTESEFIDELLKYAHLLTLSAEFNEKDFLRREISRSLKPNN
jgi:hypothetical protein